MSAAPPACAAHVKPERSEAPSRKKPKLHSDEAQAPPKRTSLKKGEGRRDSCCRKFCGEVADHTGRGHERSMQEYFSIPYGDRRTYWRSHVLEGMMSLHALLATSNFVLVAVQETIRFRLLSTNLCLSRCLVPAESHLPAKDWVARVLYADFLHTIVLWCVIL